MGQQEMQLCNGGRLLSDQSCEVVNSSIQQWSDRKIAHLRAMQARGYRLLVNMEMQENTSGKAIFCFHIPSTSQLYTMKSKLSIWSPIPLWVLSSL